MKQQIYEQQILVLLKIIKRFYVAGYLSDEDSLVYEAVAFYHQEHKGG